MLPDSWGTQTAFAQLPMFRRDGGLVRVEARNNNRGYELVPITEAADEITQAAEDFKAVYRALQGGLRTRVQAFAITREGSQRPLRKAALYTQPLRIFGLGVVKFQGERCRVWIRKKAFFPWLEENFLPKAPLSDHAKEVLLEFLSGLHVSTSRSISRDDVRQIVGGWLRIEAADKSVDQVMEHLPAGARRGGRPLKEAAKTEEWAAAKQRVIDDLKRRSAHGAGRRSSE